MSTEHVAIPLDYVCCHDGGLLLTRRSVKRLDGILDVTLDITAVTAHIDFDPRHSTRAQIIASVHQLGYRAGEADAWN